MEMKMSASGSCVQKKSLGKRLFKRFQESKYLMILFLPTALYFLIFSYAPMFGLVIAFKDYNLFKGIAESDWVGLKYFKCCSWITLTSAIDAEYVSHRDLFICIRLSSTNFICTSAQ